MLVYVAARVRRHRCYAALTLLRYATPCARTAFAKAHRRLMLMLRYYAICYALRRHEGAPLDAAPLRYCAADYADATMLPGSSSTPIFRYAIYDAAMLLRHYMILLAPICRRYAAAMAPRCLTVTHSYAMLLQFVTTAMMPCR